MTDPQQQQPDALRLQARLDGISSEQEREALAREVAADPQLRSELELQQQIDESLRKSFKPSAALERLVGRLRDGAIVHRRARRRRFAIIVAAAAASIIWIGLAWQFFRSDPDVPNYDPNQPLGEIYQKRVAEGFKPTWVCDNEREFASTFQTRQGQALLLAAMPPGTTMEGLTYVGGLSRYTTTMLARVEGAPVMVFVDRKDADTHPEEPPAKSGLHLFRKELGPLILYEVTPLDHATVMDYLKLATAPPAS